jgi:uncharacterized protein YkwD
MRAIVRVVSTAVLAASLSLAAPAVSLAQTASPAQQMLALVNAERAKAGCAAVRLDPRLTAAATKHSQDMATRNFFSHTGSDGSSFATRARREGHPRPRSENIAAGGTTAQATLRQWMGSAGHRRNILDCTAKDMGLGVATNPSSRFGTYWTQVFGLGAP